MKRALVAIGVNRVKGLPPLNDAVRGAQKMAGWAHDQGLADELVRCFTDEEKAVSIRPIQDTVREFVDRGDIEQLIIYFAGHGLNINYGEFWLLNEVLDYPSEAVNVATSVDLARASNIPHVIFVSDACRTAAAGIQQQRISGAPIFPSADGGQAEKAVDQFFACTLGNPSVEVKIQSADNAGEFRAVYTEALLGALTGEDADIVELANDGLSPPAVVRPWPLKRRLRDKVARTLVEAGVHTRVFQIPDARINSEPGVAWISRLQSPSPQQDLKILDSPDLAMRRKDFRSIRDLWDHFWGGERIEIGTVATHIRDLYGAAVELSNFAEHALTSVLAGNALPVPSSGRALVEGVADLMDEVGFTLTLEPPPFPDGGSGVVVIGMDVAGVHYDQMTTEPPDKAGRIVVSDPGEGGRMLLVLADGSGVMVPVLPGCVSVLGLHKGEIVTLALERTAGGQSDETSRLRALRALVAASARCGVFQPEPSDALRMVTAIDDGYGPDPILALYLAYALYDLGLNDALAELESRIHEAGSRPLFDLPLLRHGAASTPKAPPEMPVLARGWAILTAGGKASDDLSALARHLQPSLITRFTTEGTALLGHQFNHQFVGGFHHA